MPSWAITLRNPDLATWQTLAEEAGFTDTRLLATRPSWFLGQFYAAFSLRPPDPGDERRLTTR